MPLDTGTRPLRVIFLYLAPHRHRGSVVLRCHQLAEIGRRHLGARYAFEVREVPAPRDGPVEPVLAEIRGAIVVVSKSAISQLGPGQVEALAAANVAVLADWIDRAVDPAHLAGFALHLGASRAAVRATEAAAPGARARLLTHHADLRLHEIAFGEVAGTEALYLGHPDHFPGGPRLRERVRLAVAKRDAQFRALLPELPRYNVHVAARRPGSADLQGVKPPTKVLTAAVCGATVVVERDAPDVAEHLGEDYPYLVARSGTGPVLRMLDRVAESRDGREWRLAQDRMQDLAARTAPAEVARELGAILAEVA